MKFFFKLFVPLRRQRLREPPDHAAPEEVSQYVAVENRQVAPADITQEVRSFLPSQTFHVVHKPFAKITVGKISCESLIDKVKSFLERKEMF